MTTLNVWVKFPGNMPGRTARKGKDSKGVVYDPYEVDANGNLTFNAQTGRGLIAGQVQSWLETCWGQGLVDFYVEADMTIPGQMQLPGFTGAGLFNSANGNFASNDFTTLETNMTFHTGGAINLWLMQGLVDGMAGEALSIGSTTAIVTDAVMDDPSSAIVACHEAGHCIGLDEAENIAIDGPINNTVAVEGLPAAQKRLLMLHAGCSTFPTGGWLTISEVETARNKANDKNYPAFRGIEPDP